MDHLSYSSIGRYLRCPRSWKYHYIDKKPSPMNPSLFTGSFYHDMIAYLYTQIMNGVINAHQMDLKPVMASFWKAKKPEEVDWGKEDQAELRRSVAQAVEKYRANIMPKYKPLAVEKKMTMNVEGVQILAYIDLRAVRNDGKELVADHKWRKKSVPDQTITNDIQSIVYSMLTGLDLFEFHEALHRTSFFGSHVDIRIREVERREHDRDLLKEIIHDVLNGISKEVFPPNPTNYLCSPQYCEFWTECRMRWL